MQTERLPRSFQGPLRVHPKNPRYLTDESGSAIYLTGSHTWENFQDLLLPGKTKFNYEEYLDFMSKHNHNFIRMWMWEQGAWMAGSEEKLITDPVPFARTGPGLALDGLPKFNLDEWNEAFFDRLRSRVIDAGKRGIYVSVMLFEGWSIRKPWAPGDPWRGHPFHADNNINGVNGDIDGDEVADIHCMDNPSVVSCQEAYVRKVVDTINDLDNVMYEIINEAPGEDRTVYWQIYFTHYIQRYQSTKPKQHLVGMTPSGNSLEFTILFTGPAEWMSPNYQMDPNYQYDPPAADGRRVMLNDTDHLADQLAVDYKWVWKCLLRGQHPIFMDPWNEPEFIGQTVQAPKFQQRLKLIHLNMGYSLQYAERMNLQAMTPRGDLVSTRYCLANPGKEYLVYLVDGGTAEVNLRDAGGSFAVEWFDPVSGETVHSKPVSGGGKPYFTSPFPNDAILYLYQTEESSPKTAR